MNSINWNKAIEAKVIRYKSIKTYIMYSVFILNESNRYEDDIDRTITKT